jgi:hypothetical protein
MVERDPVSRRSMVVFAVVVVAAVLSAAALASVPKVKTGQYRGTTSEQGTVAFRVGDHGKRITGFTTTDGYNRMCQFSGGVGGIPTFTVNVPSMEVTKSRAFGGTVKATLGGFSGTFTVRGTFTAGKARGTVTEVGGTCGSGASNPTTPNYLETFTATRA